MFTLQRAASLCAAAVLSTALIAPASAAKAKSYRLTNLVSNGAVDTPFHDPNLVNTWGVSFNPAGLVWVTNNRSGTSTLYDGNGLPNPLVVNVPPAAGSGTGSPTGIVFSGSADFVVGNGTTSGPSRFIFASDDGLISGWAPNVDLNNAIRAVVTPHADYQGLAVATTAAGARLYAADFRQRRIDVFDAGFRKIDLPGRFVDPKMPAGLSPFGIQAIGDRIYVSFVKADSSGSSNGSVGAEGTGSSADAVVDIFDTDGRFIRRAASGGDLREPWGIALAPADFGRFANRLLIADFHEGTISAFDQNTGRFLGTLNDRDGKALRIQGLWGIQFGNGINDQPTNTLFFGAGPNGQGGGVYGRIDAVSGR